MITSEHLEVLRCPVDPLRDTLLKTDGVDLLCSRCEVRFRIREGLPSLLVEEVRLPHECSRLDQLPCRQLKMK